MPSATKKNAHKGKCPICGAPTKAEFRPFCSRGCRDRDLLNWLGDAYRLPVKDLQAEDSDFD
ncbi:DNA gyrase inhibitor YacG [Zymomonas sp.]|uniref:DNA gyrase inhibitor YacG n=1 Tax=Zymomonas sp. TaxID=2068624 RepID=UPI0025E67276|nr:DNA gyrase inhibitor YacG [Zymomonas sp.]MCA1955668.1 DNA gyrase inhibitor YacG [Zymomonas sp.]